MLLITGYNGFLGAALLNEQKLIEKEIIKLGRTDEADIYFDMGKEIIFPSQIDLMTSVIHVAGKAHSVPKNQEEESIFFTINLGGTQMLLQGIDNWVSENKKGYPKQFVFISTVAVYGLEKGFEIDENTPLQAGSPYGKSKVIAEKLVEEWGKKHGVAVLVLRLPLIWGEDAPGNLGAMEKAIRKGYYFRIGSGEAIRSIVDLRELSAFIANLKGEEQGIYNLVSCNVSFKEIEEYFGKKHNRRIKVIPRVFAQILAKIGDRVSIFPLNSYRLQKMENSLTFDDSTSRKVLGWRGTNVLRCL